jgi:hypothetical protein
MLMHRLPFSESSQWLGYGKPLALEAVEVPFHAPITKARDGLILHSKVADAVMTKSRRTSVPTHGYHGLSAQYMKDTGETL